MLNHKCKVTESNTAIIQRERRVREKRTGDGNKTWGTQQAQESHRVTAGKTTSTPSINFWKLVRGGGRREEEEEKAEEEGEQVQVEGEQEVEMEEQNQRERQWKWRMQSIISSDSYQEVFCQLWPKLEPEWLKRNIDEFIDSLSSCYWFAQTLLFYTATW